MLLVGTGVSIRTSVFNFWRWWYGELSLICSLIKWSWRSSQLRVVRIGDGCWTLFDHAGAVEHEALRMSFESLEGEAEACTNIFEHRKFSAIVLQIGKDLGLRRVVDLPVAAKPHLKKLLHFELDRLTPFRGEDVYLAYRIVESRNNKREMKVEFASVPKVTIDRALSIAKIYHLPVRRIEFEGFQGLDFSHCIKVSAKRSFAFRGGAFVVMGLCLALFAVVFSKVLEQQRILGSLEDEVTLARSEADEYVTKREQYDEMMGMVQFIENSRSDHLTMTDILAELTKIIPDEAYLDQLIVQNDTIQLHGFAENASILINALEESPSFKAPQFGSPVTIDNDAGRERFHLTAQLTKSSM